MPARRHRSGGQRLSDGDHDLLLPLASLGDIHAIAGSIASARVFTLPRSPALDAFSPDRWRGARAAGRRRRRLMSVNCGASFRDLSAASARARPRIKCLRHRGISGGRTRRLPARARRGALGMAVLDQLPLGLLALDGRCAPCRPITIASPLRCLERGASTPSPSGC